MKIVHIEDFFHPNAGYQINILPKYMVKQGHEVTILTSEMDKIPEGLTVFFGKNNIEKYDYEYTESTGVNIIRLPIINFISGRAIFTKALFEKVQSLKPDILYVHGNDTLTAIRYLMKIKRLNYPIVMDSHMLEMASVNKFNKIFRLIYRKFLTPKIIKNSIPIIRTQNDEYVKRFLGIPLKQCPWISVGSDTLLFRKNEEIKLNLRKEYYINEKDFVVVYTGKLDESKGGLFLAQAFKKKINAQKNIVLVVVGNTNGEYGKEVEEVFRNSENRIIRFPTQQYKDLPKFYQMSDLSVFPKQCSLSFYDAQACGLPVISEKNNINSDRLKYNNGYNFISGDIEDFRNKIMKCANMLENEYKEISNNAIKFIDNNYNYENIAKEYTNILLEEVYKFKKVNRYE